MSIIQFGNECPAILTSIRELTKNVSFDTRVGILAGLHAPQNKNAGEVELENLVSKNGHTKKVRVAYRQRQVVADVLDADQCTSGDEKPWFEENVDVGLFSGIQIDFTYESIRALCDAYSEWNNIGRPANGAQIQLMMDAASQIMPDLDALRIKIAQNAHTAFIAGVGSFSEGDAGPNTYNMLNSSNGSLNLNGFHDFDLDLAKISSGLRPIAYGSNNIWKAIKALGYGCCNDAGIDWDKMRNSGSMFDFFSDFSIDYSSVYGNANAFGMWIPGSFQFTPVLENTGNFAKKIDNVTYSTMPDPMIPGLTYDIKLIENGCDKKYTFMVYLNYDFWTKPDIFKTGDRLDGVTGLFRGIAAAV